MIIDELFEAPQRCPECGGISFSNLILAEKKDACYHKVKASAKVWPSAYASGRLVQCRKKGAANYGNKSESVAEEYELAGVDVAYELGRRAYRERKTIRDNPYSATKQARRYDEWEKGLERGKHDANDAKLFRSSMREQDVAEGVLDEAVGMIIKGAAISGPDDQDIADRIAARTGGRVDSGSRGHHILIIYPTTQDRARAAVKIRKMFPGIELYKSGGNRNAIDEQGVAEGIAEQSTAQDTVGGINTGGAKSLTTKALKKVGRAVMPTLGFTDAAERLSNKDYTGAGISAAAGGIGLIPAWPAQLASGGLELVNMTRDEANALGGYDKLAKEISKNFTIPEYDPSYLPENPAQSEGVVSLGKAAYNRGKDFVRYLRRDAPEPPRVTGGTLDQGSTTIGGVKRPAGTVSYSNQPGTARTVQQQDLLPGETLDQAMRRIANQSGSKDSDKLGGKNVKTTPGPRLKPGSTNVQLDPVVDVPAYVRQDKPDPVTIPKPGTKPKIIIRPGETMDQAIERTRVEQEFGKFLKGQGEQTFVPPGAVNPDLGNVRPGLDEESRKKRKEPEVDYDDEYDAMVSRVKKLAGLGPMKTVWDPAKRVYKNVPTAQQPKK